MNHRGQRALRDGDWKYLRVDGHDYLFNIPADERERANHAGREPARLAAMRAGLGGLGGHHAADPRGCDRQPGLFGQGHAAALRGAYHPSMPSLQRLFPFLSWPRPDAALLRGEVLAGLTVGW
jgi:hypothetical protein